MRLSHGLLAVLASLFLGSIIACGSRMSPPEAQPPVEEKAAPVEEAPEETVPAEEKPAKPAPPSADTPDEERASLDAPHGSAS